jgi:hypothetical protein
MDLKNRSIRLWQCALEEKYAAFRANHFPAIEAKLRECLFPRFWLNGEALRLHWIKEADSAFVSLGGVEAELAVLPLL